MASKQPIESSSTNPKDSSTTSEAVFQVPEWINEENFTGVFEENFAGFMKILNFEAGKTGGAGENYASIMVRVKTTIELEDGSTKDVAFVIKTVPQGGEGAQMITDMGVFTKESAMYGKYLHEFEQMYADVGKQVTFGPKFYKFKKDPGAMYILLEDLSPAGFKNVKRQTGLDREHTESVLKMLAELHAASAVRHATKGDYEPIFKTFMFNEDNRDQVKGMMGPMLNLMNESFSKYEGIAKYFNMMPSEPDGIIDMYISSGKQDPDGFNVISHGDLWANNIMFRYNDEGKREQTMFVDFQLSRHASPACDLFYFLMSSTSFDIRLSCFDDFVKFYHDNLIENLKLLNYSKKLPSLKQLRMDMLRYGTWGFSTAVGVLSVVLLDPTENATIDNFFDDGDQGTHFKRLLYTNPRYVKQLEAILPWLYKRGYLDANN